MEEVISIVLGALSGLVFYLLLKVLDLRREVKIRKELMEEQEKIYRFEIAALKKKGKDKTGVA